MAPLDVCRARPQGLIAASVSQSVFPQHNAGQSGSGRCPSGRPPMHTHLWLSSSQTHGWGKPHATAPEVSYKDLCQRNFYWDVLLEEVASGQIRSLGLSPCRQRALGRSESSGAGCSRPYCSITVALGWGPGRGAAGSRTSDGLCPFQKEMLLRPAPPFPRLLRRRGARHPRDALSPPHQVLGNFHDGPGLLAHPWRLGRARQDPRSAPLTGKPRTLSHQFSERCAAAFRCALDSADTRPGIGGNQGLPRPPPPAKLPPVTCLGPRR